MSKVIAIVGSPRADGNTEYMAKVALKELEAQGIETELISLIGKNVSPCTGCYACIEAKSCVIKDDFHEIFQKMLEADGILLCSPVYHASITPELKAVMDRAGFSGRWAANDMKAKNESYAWCGTVFSGKVAAPLAVARRAGQDFAIAQMAMWMMVNDFVVIGSTYWNIFMAGKGGAMDAAEDLEGIGTIEHMAQNMAHVIKQLNK